MEIDPIIGELVEQRSYSQCPLCRGINQNLLCLLQEYVRTQPHVLLTLTGQLLMNDCPNAWIVALAKKYRQKQGSR